MYYFCFGVTTRSLLPPYAYFLIGNSLFNHSAWIAFERLLTVRQSKVSAIQYIAQFDAFISKFGKSNGSLLDKSTIKTDSLCVLELLNRDQLYRIVKKFPYLKCIVIRSTHQHSVLKLSYVQYHLAHIRVTERLASFTRAIERLLVVQSYICVLRKRYHVTGYLV